uniref:Putative insulin-like growth factor-binding protein complex acid labile subunit n=1 Tax=Panstrongylus lignarius TaxID=156445 RepID=A0A224X852_9HEMI
MVTILKYWQYSLALILVGVIWHCQALLQEQQCPESCDCHYFRINWVTDCSNRALTTVPTTYEEGLSPNVYILNLNDNNITDINAFPDDIKLRSLLLAGNQLTTITRIAFFGLGYLLDLDLSNNKIVYIEPDTFVDSPGLISLKLQNNQLERIPGPFLITKSLLNLDISDCQINYLNQYFFTETPALNSMDLSGNPIEEIKPNVFNRIISLQVLKLNRCKLTTISINAFDKLEDLKTLELSNNYLKGPLDWTTIFAPLIRLESLDLRNSGISNLPDGIFEKNVWISSLILAENKLSNEDIVTVLGKNLRNLDLLDLYTCSINGISAKSFANATKLKTLILSGNTIPSADLTAVLSPLTNLQRLSMKNCSLTSLPANTFNKFTNLEELDLSMNPLNDAFIHLLNPLERLEHLDMSYSDLEYISNNTFSKMTSLKTLTLSGNSLKKLESGVFQNLTNLRVLKLSNCGLTGLNETVFQEKSIYAPLEELYLSGNPLIIAKKGSFLPTQLNHLKTLDLSSCNITYIPPNALHSFGNIVNLNLYGNQLTSDDEHSLEFLDNLPLLEKLDMSQNQLKWITPLLFRNNLNLKWLKLDDNPWQCGCNIADMWEWAYTVKGDLSLLVGSTLPEDDHARKNMKKSKALLCEHFTKKTPIKARKQKHLTDHLINHTWSYYVQESNCDSTRRLMPAKFIGTLTVVSESLSQQQQPVISSKFAPTWAWSSALILSLLLITIASILVKSTMKQLQKVPS